MKSLHGPAAVKEESLQYMPLGNWEGCKGDESKSEDLPIC